MRLPKYTLIHPKETPQRRGVHGKAHATSTADVVTIGIWDLNARLGFLGRVIGAMNRAQTRFAFREVLAPVPAGMISRPERVVAWIERRLARKLTPSQRKEIGDNVIDDDFYALAEQIRSGFGLDYLAGVTAGKVAGEDSVTGVYWDYMGTYYERSILVAAYNLRTYAAQAGWPIEAAVAWNILSLLFVAIPNRGLDLHDDDRGCLFDYNWEWSSLVDSLKKAQIDAECLRLLWVRDRQPAELLVARLKAYCRRWGQPPSG